MSLASLGSATQVGYLVDDLDEAIRGWIDRLGVGPWTVFRNVELDGAYRGEPTHVTMHVALGYQGETQIELIQPVNDAPSPYRGGDGKVLLGIHHVAWLVDDLDARVAALAASGMDTRFTAANPTTRVAYLADPATPGALIELIESAVTADLIVQGIAASRDWDGSNPVTEYDLSAQ